VYGPNDTDTTFIRYLIRSFRNGEVPKLTPCGQIWDYIYSRDAADALLAIGERGKDGRTYCIGSGIPRPMKEYVEEIRSVVDPDGPVEYGAIDYYPHQPMYLCADIRDLTEDTGFPPKVPFVEGIRKIVDGM
jgi:nucleoside-diphosphate-sugar epimerase